MEPLEFSSFSFIPTLITSLITGAITWLGTFIFYKQKRDGMDISNEAQRSAEWKKLYDESKSDSAEKDKKIDELRRQINDLNARMNEMDRIIQLNSIYAARTSRARTADHRSPKSREMLKVSSLSSATTSTPSSILS